MKIFDKVHKEKGEVLDQKEFGYEKIEGTEKFVFFENSGLRKVDIDNNKNIKTIRG